MVGGNVEYHPAAVEEGRAAYAWYSGRSRLAGMAFGLELDLAISAVAEAPTRWPIYLGQFRRYVLHRFPFVVIYREHLGMIQVIAIAHARRRPGYWAERVRGHAP